MIRCVHGWTRCTACEAAGLHDPRADARRALVEEFTAAAILILGAPVVDEDSWAWKARALKALAESLGFLDEQGQPTLHEEPRSAVGTVEFVL